MDGIGSLEVRYVAATNTPEKLSPSIFVYIFPELQLKNELKGNIPLRAENYFILCTSYVRLYLFRNWENAEPICTQPQAGQNVISLVFNPLNWLQLCALGTTSLTVWNIEKSAKLPATDGSFVERLVPTFHTVSDKLPYFGLEMPPSAISGLKGDKAESILVLSHLTPTAICWTATSELYVGCAEGFLLLVDPESLSVSVLFNPTSKQTHTLGHSKYLKVTGIHMIFVVHCLQIKATQIDLTQTWQLEGPVTTVMYSPDYETLLLSSNTVST
uniref:Cilia- and flagella-associated protein 43 n=1 Tax=Sander lucioperca TaxID=283035 RepID=A0A8C9ZPE8_SANLU